MRTKIAMIILLAAILFHNGTAIHAAPLNLDRTWHEEMDFPENVYREFLRRDETTSGPLAIVLNPKDSNDNFPRLIWGDIRRNIAVFFYRGEFGNNGFVLDKNVIFSNRPYVLEVRWLDMRNGRWHCWWNRKKLNDTLLSRPELYPQAGNAPF